MASKRDYYDVLGISKTATEDEIKKAYRTLAKKYHPDVSKEPNAETKFKEVQEAYDTLGDAGKRSTYDQFGHSGNPFEGFSSGGQGFNFGGFGDIFSSFFGGGQRSQQNYSGPQAGDDIERVMTIDFMEAVLGAKKTIKVEVEEDCKTCHGIGAESQNDIETCDRCHGQGYVHVEQRTIFGAMSSQQVCPKCGGSGKYIKRKCSTCQGQGRTKTTKTVDVNIPAGVQNNMSLRVPGYGYGGHRGGENGNLYLNFRVRPHKVFKRKDNDIILEVPITTTQAVLGTSIEIPTIYGDVELKIPAGIQPETTLRMRDKGVAHVRTGKKGDQLVVIKIVVPKNISNEEKKLYQQIDKLEVKEKDSVWTKFKNLFKN
ncbi:MAG: molecular chaperone DnaJ [Bacilli bacterium]